MPTALALVSATGAPPPARLTQRAHRQRKNRRRNEPAVRSGPRTHPACPPSRGCVVLQAALSYRQR